MSKSSNPPEPPQCAEWALFLHTLTFFNCLLLMCALVVAIPFIWTRMRKLVVMDDESGTELKVWKSNPAVDHEDHGASSRHQNPRNAIDREDNDAVDQENNEPPPPYANPQSGSTSNPAKLSSATSFVLGTALFMSVFFLLVLLALAIQNIVYCHPWSHVLFHIILWLIFTALAVNVSFVASYWLILLRNLWGRRGRKAMKIQVTTVPMVLFCAVFGLLSVVSSPVWGFGMLLVQGVKRLQRRFCDDEMEEEENGAMDERALLTVDDSVSKPSEETV